MIIVKHGPYTLSPVIHKETKKERLVLQINNSMQVTEPTQFEVKISPTGHPFLEEINDET